ncbi:MAG: hypothetical protein K8S55_02140 [Phycisphaerae bacterium]|nr:hypothetical protein [Phycisphaerae bacterium]
MRIICMVIGLVILLAGISGCLTVNAPRKVEVNANNNDGGSWKQFGKDVAKDYSSNNGDSKKKKSKKKYDDDDDDDD